MEKKVEELARQFGEARSILLVSRNVLKATFGETLLFGSLEGTFLEGFRFTGVMVFMSKTADLGLSPDVWWGGRFERKIMVTSCGPE